MSSPASAPPQSEFLDPRSFMPLSQGEPLTLTMGRVRPTTGWQTFYSNVYAILLAITSSGTTAQRPTKFLFIGRPFFDTSLGAHGKPIWVAAVAAGTATWIDAASNVV